MKLSTSQIKRYVRGFASGALALGAAVLSALADYPSAILSDNPAAYWRFNEVGVAPPIDLATNLGSLGAADNGTYNGSTALLKGLVGPFAGSGATAFDGSGQNVNIPFDANMNPTSGQFTVEAWVRPAQDAPQSSFAAVLSCGKLVAPRSGWLIYQASEGWNLRLYNQNAGNFSLSITAGGHPIPGTWVYLAATFDGTTARLYVNGVQVASGEPTGTPAFVPNVDGAFKIGTRSDELYSWKGAASEVAFYSRPLATSAIAAHFAAASTNAGGYPAQIVGDDPVGYWRLNEPLLPLPIAANSGSLGAAANGTYHYGATTLKDLDRPPFPGFETTNTVFAPSGSNGIVTVPPLNLYTNTVTFECWVKRHGDQPQYAGLLMHQSDSGNVTGLYFRDTSSLGYCWNNQATTYNWDSGLVPPDGVWTYVALVVAPSQAVMYMCDGASWSMAINVVNHPVQAFAGTTRIGADSIVTRFFHGQLDEAAIYGQALTEGQLLTHALAGFGGSRPPVLLIDPPIVTPEGAVYATTPFTMVANVSGQTPLSFQWLKNGSKIPGATGVSYSVAAASSSDAADYSVIITNAYGAVTSLVAVVTVKSAVPTITRQPVARTVPAGGAASFTVVADGPPPLKYQWTRAGTNLPGATNVTILIPSAYYTDAGSYSVRVANSVDSTMSASARLTVLPPPTFANLTNNLVLHLRFDGNYLDYSGRGNDASALGSALSFLPGRIGQGVHVATSPNTNYLQVLDSAGDLTFDETASFSVAFWLKYTGGFNDVPIIGNAVNSTWQLGWVFTDSASAGQIEWSLSSTADSGIFLRDPVPGCPPINDDTWHSVVGVVDRAANEASVYIDGVPAGSWSIAGLGTLVTGQTLTIGQDPTGSFGTATFDLDDLGIWRQALSAYDAASLFAAGQRGQSFDVYGPVKVNVNRIGANVDLSWQAGTLLQSTNVSGAFTPVAGATVPFYRATAGSSAMFFRVQQ